MLFFIETSENESVIKNMFHNEDNKQDDGTYLDVQDIKYIIINDIDKRVKINYKIQPIKALIERIEDSIKTSLI